MSSKIQVVPIIDWTGNWSAYGDIYSDTAQVEALTFSTVLKDLFRTIDKIDIEGHEIQVDEFKNTIINTNFIDTISAYFESAIGKKYESDKFGPEISNILNELIQIVNQIGEPQGFIATVNILRAFVNISIIMLTRTKQVIAFNSTLNQSEDLTKDNSVALIWIILEIENIRNVTFVEMSSTLFATIAVYDLPNRLGKPAQQSQSDQRLISEYINQQMIFELSLYLSVILQKKYFDYLRQYSLRKRFIPPPKFETNYQIVSTLVQNSIVEIIPFIKTLIQDAFNLAQFNLTRFLQDPRMVIRKTIRARYLLQPWIASQIIREIYIFLTENENIFVQILDQLNLGRFKEEFFFPINVPPKIRKDIARYSPDLNVEFVRVYFEKLFQFKNPNGLFYNQLLQAKIPHPSDTEQFIQNFINDTPYSDTSDMSLAVEDQILFRRFFVSLFPLTQESVYTLTSILGKTLSLALFNRLSQLIVNITQQIDPRRNISHVECTQLKDPAFAIRKLLQNHFYFTLPPWTELYGP